MRQITLEKPDLPISHIWFKVTGFLEQNRGRLLKLMLHICKAI
jgi:hypothetical protein